MAQEELSKTSPKESRFRVILAIIISLTVIIYTAGILWGYLPEERQIDAVHLAT